VADRLEPRYHRYVLQQVMMMIFCVGIVLAVPEGSGVFSLKPS
jgi:hypothetical protein